jgi:WD40 repeat protein
MPSSLTAAGEQHRRCLRLLQCKGGCMLTSQHTSCLAYEAASSWLLWCFDCRLVTGGEDGVVRLWDVRDGLPRRKLRHDAPLHALAFDDTHLVVGCWVSSVHAGGVCMAGCVWQIGRSADRGACMSMPRTARVVMPARQPK